MFRKILKLSIILSISVHGNNVNQQPQFAVSSQSYHREDVPLSYKFSAVHEYVRPVREPDYQAKTNYRPIQYAPVGTRNNKAYQVGIKHANNEDKKIDTRFIITPNLHKQYHATEGNPGRLEPKHITEHINKQNQNAYTHIPQHNNIVAVQQRQALGNPLFRPVEHLENSAPIFVYLRKQNQFNTPNQAISNVSPVMASKNQYAYEHAPVEEQHPRSIHDQLQFEKPSSAYQHVPRIHMNYARGFHIANVTPQAPHTSGSYSRYPNAYYVTNTQT